MTTTPLPTIQPDPTHVAALIDIRTKADRVRYACEHAPTPHVPVVLAWLTAHGANPAPHDRSEIAPRYAIPIVKSHREARSMADTGDLPVLTDAVLAEFDAATPDGIAGAKVQTDPAEVQTPPTVDGDQVQTEPEPAAPADIEPAPTAEPEPEPAEPADTEPADKRSRKARGTGPFYLVALIATFISLDTAFRFFGEILHITGSLTVTIPLWNGQSWHLQNAPVERWVLCGVVEMGLIACGYAMRSNVRRGDKPGPAQLVAFALVAFSTVMAITLGGPVAGVARAILGPVLGLIFLHLALGIEVHVRSGGTKSGTLSKVTNELRERALSRLGLGDDNRDAITRTRDRAIDQATRLATARFVIAREVRLARAVHRSGVATNPAARERLKAQVATQRNITDLIKLEVPSPWK